MRGRKPKPTALKLIQGNPGRRPIEPELKVPPAIADCPAHLDAEARKEGERVAPQLYELGLLTALDRTALAIYCACWSRWVWASKQIEAEELTVPSRGGREKANPLLAIASQAQRMMHKMATELGMTPGSRPRIRVSPPPSRDPFDDLLSS
jgi:P27 family predicted phage terminase small subunit